jgi:hypothetical protein
MMERGLDHLVYATPDLDASVEELAERFGTEPVPGGAHPGWGTWNALIGLGTGMYLEIIGPDPTQPDPEQARPFLIDDLTEARLVTWAYRHPDPESLLESLQDVAQLGPVRRMSRSRPDGSTLRWRLSDPQALPSGGVIPFAIDWGTTPHPSTDLPNHCKLLELVVSHADADRLRPALETFGVSIVAAPEPGIRARLQTPNGEIDLS